ncbi:hypothetical protein TNCV_1144361 [Trichonephila clavipes]|nr:hypothetical protein TNCV_1144361 [Trichonephila clavipes]
MPTVQLYGSSEKHYKINMLTKSVLFLHENVKPHTSQTTENLIESFGLEVLDHAPYSPDLAPSNFHLFLYLKHSLGGKRSTEEGRNKL